MVQPQTQSPPWATGCQRRSRKARNTKVRPPGGHVARARWNQCGPLGTAPPAPICHLKTGDANRTDARQGRATLLARSGGDSSGLAGRQGGRAPRLCLRPASQTSTGPTPTPLQLRLSQVPRASASLAPRGCQPPGNRNPKCQSSHSKLLTSPNFFLKRA